MIQLSSSAIRVNAPADQQLNCDAKETYCFTAKKQFETSYQQVKFS